MTIFKRSLDNFSSKMFVAPVDRYELEVLKVSLKSIDYNGEKVPIIAFAYRIENAEQEANKQLRGKPVSHELWIRTEADIDNALKIVQCAVGIKPGTDQSDAEFRMRFADQDFGVDTDTMTLGEGFQKAVKGRVSVKLTSKAGKGDKADNMYQQFSGYQPA